MNKKFVVLALLILSIISVCPLPFDNGIFSVGIINTYGRNQFDDLFRLIEMSSGFNLIFYVIILVGMILYFKSYSYSSDSVFTSFIVLYILLLIIQAKGLEFLIRFSSSHTMATILLIITIILMAILTILFIKLVNDCYPIDYQIPIVIFTILVFITQSILFIGTYIYTIKNPLTSTLYLNFLNFSGIMSIISFLLITTLKVFFILVVIKEGINMNDKKNPILNENA